MKTQIDPTKYTAGLRPGKFELEPPATEYFYEQMLNGDGEAIVTDEDTSIGEFFHIYSDEAEAFDLPNDHWQESIRHPRLH
jgi:hypothetical protein